jgi:tRNA U38,U39,U40 pseudouridine synthase TruA
LKGSWNAYQTLEAFQPAIALSGHRNPTLRRRLYQQLLDAIVVHRVADRPNRFEPRQLKRRKKRYDFLMKPRWAAKRETVKGVTEN